MQFHDIHPVLLFVSDAAWLHTTHRVGRFQALVFQSIRLAASITSVRREFKLAVWAKLSGAICVFIGSVPENDFTLYVRLASLPGW